MNKSKLVLLSAVSAFLLLTGCSKKQQFAEIPDVRNYPQDINAYLVEETPAEDAPEADPALQDGETPPEDAPVEEEAEAEFDGILQVQEDYANFYFKAWTLTDPLSNREDITWPWSVFNASNAYGANLRLISKDWFNEMKMNANFNEVGLINKQAITLRQTNLRVFPSKNPVFKDPKKDGEGYPFDYAQNSLVNANEPIFVSHFSKDKEWVYVETSYAAGWIRSQDISYIEEKIFNNWMNARQAIFVKEGEPIISSKNRFLFRTRIGMMLPIVRDNKNSYTVLAVEGNDEKYTARYTLANVSKEIAIDKPLVLNKTNLAKAAQSLMPSKYGWGGMYNNRDCSSLLKDLYAPFNYWLPRNSAAQAKEGIVIDLKDLSSEDKEQKIMDMAVPFKTLLYKKGHIMLYIGKKDGRAMVMHNYWGVPTYSFRQAGRKVVGKTVITTLTPELGVDKRDKRKPTLLKQIESMNILPI